MIYPKHYSVIVIGAGHAGCEAALAASRMGEPTLLLTMNLDSVAQMSCNPAIGGLAKGHIAREIDALGGEMAKVADKTAIQFRMLNTKKGPAVWAPRAQCDKKLYQFTMKEVLEKAPNLDVKQQIVEEIFVENGKVLGVGTHTGMVFKASVVIVTPGTFLNGLIHIGEDTYKAGRAGEFPAERLSDSLRRLGFEIGRLKTGTPARVNKNTIDLDKLIVQEGDREPSFFSFSTTAVTQPQVPCYITYTNTKTHQYILANLGRAPLYSGQIKGIGPRYCPSIEGKVVEFSDKDRHQVFLEPEGLNTNEIYLNGVSTSLPQDVQIDFLRTIRGLENAEIMRFGYAIEYDFCPPTQLKPTLETKIIENLYFAGQINGTSGYEEAAGQGLMAGINAVLKLRGEGPFILERSEAYIGVLIDDLVTKGTKEPYRMFTSRAEHRLLLRQDNADLRLMEYGRKLGLISDEIYNAYTRKKEKIGELIELLNKTRVGNGTLAQALRRPEVSFHELKKTPSVNFDFPRDVVSQVETAIKYEGYINRELIRAEKVKRLEKKLIPNDIEYEKIKGLRKEALQKLQTVRPVSIGQASRISGISPCDLSLLLVYLEGGKGIKPFHVKQCQKS